MIKNSYLLLASNSPRRAQILKKFGYTFTVTSHHFDEDSLDPNDFLSPRNYVRFLAKSKAHSIKRSSYNLILSADTIVVFNNIIFNKPTNRDQAFSEIELGFLQHYSDPQQTVSVHIHSCALHTDSVGHNILQEVNGLCFQKYLF